MANIPMKSIKLPGLADTYTFVQIDDGLTVAGKAADAAITGNRIDALKSALNENVTTRNYVEDKNLDSTTGALVDEEGTCVSDWIPYTWTGLASYDCGDNTKFTYRIEFYDAEKNHLSGFRNPSSTGGVTYRGINAETQVTGTVGFVRFSFKNGTVGKVFVNAQTNYWIATSTTIKGVFPSIGNLNNLDTNNKDNLVDAINEVKNSIPDDLLPIDPKETTFFFINPNLINPAYNTIGEYVNQGTGAFVGGTSGAAYTRTDYIPIEAGKKYCLINSEDYNAGIRYAFYTSAKAYISGDNVSLSDINNIVTAPATAAYMVMSASTTRFPFMIAQSDTKIPYVAYGGNYIFPEYIVEDLTDLIVNIPTKIYALVGYETNIYYENIVENWENYNFNTACSKGSDMERGYTITPESADVGSYTLSITISSKDGKASKTVTTTLIITSSNAGGEANIKLLVLGDSTTNSGYAVTKLAQNLESDVMSVTLLGTRGTSPYLHEGRSGWTFNLYCNSASSSSITNPFFNPTTEKFDASYYFTNTGVSVPDWFFINLGINDVFNYTLDASLNNGLESIIDMCDEMIASVKAVNNSIKVGLCLTIPPNHSQDAFGKAYGCGQTRDRYKRNNLIWVHELIETYDGRETDGIYLVPIFTNLDTVYNMGIETLPVNARNTTVTYESPIENGGVHPAESGYWQIADVYTAFLKAHAND